jgi:hypothetical protein
MPVSSNGPFVFQLELSDPFRANPTLGRRLAICPLDCDNGQPRVGLHSSQPSANRLPGDLWRMAAAGGLQPVTPLSAGQHSGCPFPRARPPTPPAHRRCDMRGHSRHHIAGAPSFFVHNSLSRAWTPCLPGANCRRHYTPFSLACQVGLTDARRWSIIRSFACIE